MNRTVIRINDRWFVYASEHPLEERITELTDDYRLDHETFILPEAVAWDGVDTMNDEER